MVVMKSYLSDLQFTWSRSRSRSRSYFWRAGAGAGAEKIERLRNTDKITLDVNFLKEYELKKA